VVPVPARRALIRTLDREHGVGLIEVLLAVVLMSIGFLASARMQIEGMAASQSAYSASQAKLMVQDMSERMRANRVALADNEYDDLQTSANTTDPGCYTSGNPCTPSQRVAADIHEWSQFLHPEDQNATPLLPSTDDVEAIGTIDFEDGGYRVTVTWADRDSAEGREYSVRVMP